MYPDNVHYEQSEEYVTAIWSQVAEAFAEEKIDVWGDFDKAIEIFSIILGMNKKAKPKKTTKKG